MSWHIILPDLPGDEDAILTLRNKLRGFLLREGVETSTVTIDSALFRLQTRPPQPFQQKPPPYDTLPRIRRSMGARPQ